MQYSESAILPRATTQSKATYEVSSTHDDVVDWNVDQLDEKPYESHYQEAHGCSLRHLHEFCETRAGSKCTGAAECSTLLTKTTEYKPLQLSLKPQNMNIASTLHTG